MNKNGLTLSEMLVVILILSLIVLSIFPNITGMIKKIDNDKYQRFLNDVFLATEAYIQANISKYSNIKQNNKKVYVRFNELVDSGYLKSTIYDNKNKDIVKNEDFTVEVYLNDGEYSYKLYENIGPLYIAPLPNETHKGIVYLDPTNISAECNASNSVSTTETKTGCMKWYIFNDSGDNYTMILDHNTTACIRWNDLNSNVVYESSNLKAVVDDLVTTSGWEVTPRLITADEVNTITGKTGFDVGRSGRYYFDTLTQTKATFSETVRSKYDWLYNNLYKCKTDSTDYGCTIEDGNTYSGYGIDWEGVTEAYWTSTPFSIAGCGGAVWHVDRFGSLYFSSAYNADHGVRPVIEVPKSLVRIE